MPLSEKARIEVYIRDFPDSAYHSLVGLLERELTFAFGRSTIVRGLDSSYLSQSGQQVLDRVNLLYADCSFTFEENLERLSHYADELTRTVATGFEDEIIRVAVHKVHHALPASA